MPEISLFLFDLEQLMKLFPKQDRQLRDKILEYEQKTQEDMAQNRIKLFSEFGYESEFDKVVTW
ncbi:hypothetical protein IJ472_01810 [bacterium]|nr:hypothetical protein [bacterium]